MQAVGTAGAIGLVVSLIIIAGSQLVVRAVAKDS
ncbi:hypothetical protein ARTHRO9AX_160001 [Arthrobacter sp. 9AX]|nr:hypothetical protein ARTHRO9AX_160001 [Arthrobacter sp. 9AX]